MSEFYVQVVEIGKVGKHPYADSLSISQVLGSYPVIFRTGEFQPGDKAVYLSTDAMLPLNDERWAFLRKGDNWQDKYHKLKAARLRNIFSMGILTKADPSWEVGQDVREILQIKKWEPEEKLHMNTESEPNPGFMYDYTDIEGYRKFPDQFAAGEEIVILEKIHGTNGKWCFKDGRLWVGSHHQVKKDMPGCVWWEAIRQQGHFKTNEEMNAFGMWEDHLFFGEVYGQVQDLKYGTSQQEPLKIAIFDIFSLKDHKYLNWEQVEFICQCAALPIVPVLYKGLWNPDLVPSLAEGQTTVPGANNIREGFVLKPVVETVNEYGRRKILKYVGEGYFLRKENK